MRARAGQRFFAVRSGRLAARLLTVSLLAATVPVVVVPADAAVHMAATRLAVHAAPSTVHVGSTLVISGSVSPRTGAPVVLQRLVGTNWHTVGQRKVSAKGGFSFSLKAPAKATGWVLRVSRTGSATAKAGVSGLLHVRVVTAVYVVKIKATATVAAGAQVVVTGSVRPKATGSVTLQRLAGKVWIDLASARLTSTSTFVLRALRPAGSYRLRALKAFTAKIAGGVSPALSVRVAAPVVSAPPVVTTTALLPGRVGVSYSATLTAAGGVPPYGWTSTGLPAGLVLSTAGVISGTPTAAGVSTVTIVVADGAGHTGSAALTLTVGPAAGALWAWGNNAYGQLGNGSTTSTDVLVPVTGLTSVTSVTGGQGFGYALDSSGTVWAWGIDTDGQLGNNSASNSTVPVAVTGLTDVTAIAAGVDSGYALRSDGTVWAWGNNFFGQLGNNSATDSSVPVPVSGLTKVTAIAASAVTAYALRADGTVWAWGANTSGQLGNDSTAMQSEVPVQVSGLTSVTAIAAAGSSGFALTSNGLVSSWGYNEFGDLGNNSTPAASSIPVQVSGLTKVTAIAGGGDSGYALRGDGTVWDWGQNTDGQLGNNDSSDTNSPVPVQVSGLTSVTAIAGGSASGYALRSDGYVSAWGQGVHGELGDGLTAASNVPVQASGLTGVIDIGSGSQSSSGYAIEAG